MTPKHWTQWAQDFDNQVTDAFSADFNGVIQKAMGGVFNARRKRLFVDFGCGSGSFALAQAKKFDRCVGIDSSEGMIELAKRKGRGVKNVEFVCESIQGYENSQVTDAGLVACFNVITATSKSVRDKIWRRVGGMLARDGVALVVCPSLESVQMVTAACKERSLEPTRYMRRGGIVVTEGVSQQFFTRESLVAELEANGLKSILLEKVPYKWPHEGLDGRVMRGVEYPWDWLVGVRRARA